MGQMKSQNRQFFHESVILKVSPTKRHTILIMWAHSPHENKIKDIKNKNLLKNLN